MSGRMRKSQGPGCIDCKKRWGDMSPLSSTIEKRSQNVPEKPPVTFVAQICTVMVVRKTQYHGPIYTPADPIASI